MAVKVSVIMSTYNETEKFVRAAIESVISQTFKDFELIILQDNPDNKEIDAVIKEYENKDKRIKAEKNEKNLGVVSSLNKLIKLSQGEWIARLDADDIFYNDRLETELKYAEKNNLDFVSASKRNINENGRPLGNFVFAASGKNIKKLMPYDNLIVHSTVLMKREVVQNLGGYRHIISCEDYDLWMRMIYAGLKMSILPDILADYRIRENSISRTDYYIQYVSERYIQKWYQKHGDSKEVFSENEYNDYVKGCILEGKKKEKYNEGYKIYYQAKECLKNKKIIIAFPLFVKSIMIEPEILAIVYRKTIFHIKKKIILSKERNKRNV